MWLCSAVKLSSDRRDSIGCQVVMLCGYFLSSFKTSVVLSVELSLQVNSASQFSWKPCEEHKLKQVEETEITIIFKTINWVQVGQTSLCKWCLSLRSKTRHCKATLYSIFAARLKTPLNGRRRALRVTNFPLFLPHFLSVSPGLLPLIIGAACWLAYSRND